MDLGRLCWLGSLVIYDSLQIGFRVERVLEQMWGELVRCCGEVLDQGDPEGMWEGISELLGDQLREISGEFGEEAVERIWVLLLGD